MNTDLKQVAEYWKLEPEQLELCDYATKIRRKDTHQIIAVLDSRHTGFRPVNPSEVDQPFYDSLIRP